MAGGLCRQRKQICAQTDTQQAGIESCSPPPPPACSKELVNITACLPACLLQRGALCTAAPSRTRPRLACRRVPKKDERGEDPPLYLRQMRSLLTSEAVSGHDGGKRTQTPLPTTEKPTNLATGACLQLGSVGHGSGLQGAKVRGQQQALRANPRVSSATAVGTAAP